MAKREIAGFIYIAGVFHVTHPRVGEPRDNDPHVWSVPFTWGICRNDLRKKARCGFHIFFVLPARFFPRRQTIFAYMKIDRIITHDQAFLDYPEKRITVWPPNGNILVDEEGRYNVWDGGDHLGKFDRVRPRYAVADSSASRRLSPQEMDVLAPEFVPALRTILGRTGRTARDVITRAGRSLTQEEVDKILAWIDTAAARAVDNPPPPLSPARIRRPEAVIQCSHPI